MEQDNINVDNRNVLSQIFCKLFKDSVVKIKTNSETLTTDK